MIVIHEKAYYIFMMFIVIHDETYFIIVHLLMYCINVNIPFLLGYGKDRYSITLILKNLYYCYYYYYKYYDFSEDKKK